MKRAWQKTLTTGLEQSFLVFPNGDSFDIGTEWTGTRTASNQLEYVEFIISISNGRAPVINVHTHPGEYGNAYNPSTQDSNFNSKTNTVGIIITRWAIQSGRGCQ